MRLINDLQTFQEMLQAERAVVILMARWSGPAFHSRKAVQQLERSLQSGPAADNAARTWWELDVTDDAGEIWDATCRWLEPQDPSAHSLLIGGAGSVVWCSRGRVLASLISALQTEHLWQQDSVAFDPEV
jgi:hypothetical protein